jgi:hypothetical protein
MARVTTVSRVDTPYEGDERTRLEAWLEYHRATLTLKCEGLLLRETIDGVKGD